MVKKEFEKGLCKITLEGAKGNMLDRVDINSLLNDILEAKEDREVKGVLLTGGGHAFCVGLNLGDEVQDGYKEEAFALFDKLLYELFFLPKPVVVAVNGHSIGGGLLLQACADYTIVVDCIKTKFGLPEVKLGLTIDQVMWELLSFNLKSTKILSTLLLTSEYICVQKLLDIGLADELTSGDTLLEIAHEKLYQLMSMPLNSYCMTKKLVKQHTAEKMKQGLENKVFQVFNKVNSK